MMMSRALAQRRQPRALDADAVEERAVALQRVRAAHRLEAAHEHRVVRIEEDHPHVDARRAAPG